MFIIWLLVFTSSVMAEIITQGSPYTSVIQPYETQKAKFSSSKGLKRILYYQCTGTSDLTIVDGSSKEVESFKDFVSKEADCKDFIYHCLVDPCSVSTCPDFPQALCISNYCGGCFAVYKYNGEDVDCGETRPADEATYTRGAPPHMSVLLFEDSEYTFNFRGKKSNIDDTNTYLVYVFDNKGSDKKHVVLDKDHSEVTVEVTNNSVSVSWLEPLPNENIQISQYCLFHKEAPLGANLHGNWLVCGHEVKNTASPVTCVNSTDATLHGLTRDKTHYIWVVVYTAEGETTAYPFVRIDLETAPENSVRARDSCILAYLSCLVVLLSYLVF